MSSSRSNSPTYDVAIIGGGPAGLSAALWLARYLHKVVLIDSGDPRNWETRGINGFLGAHGIRSPELRLRGRADAEKYEAKIIDDLVDTIKKLDDDCFRLRLEKNSTLDARRILLAIGIKDIWPKIPGLADCFGETAHVCPDCDGWDTRGRKTIVVGSGRKAVGMALALTTWTEKIVICTNGERAEMTAEQLAQLQKLNVPVLEQVITCARSTDRKLNCLELDNGMALDCDRLYFAIGQVPADDIGAQLGCKRDDMGLIVVDEHHHTSVKGVYAAGDIIPGPQLAVAAAAGGAIAAIAIHHSLVPKERRLADG